VIKVSQDAKKLQKTILVVDDTVDNLLLISDLLKDRYRVKTFVNPKEALEYLQTSTCVDLILLDIVMPELNGYDVIDILKRTKATQDIPVIFLTSLSSMEDEQKGLDLGASDYITKPISAPIMLSRIKTQLENKAAKDFLNDAMIEMLFRTAPLHDIGKVGIADKILMKPTTLTYKEFEVMKTHTILGKEAI
jgi:response regulator RpfG family c-di-GMP phosphodiesterase